MPTDRATELQLAGHGLLEEGRYGAAISDLRSALRAGGESVSNCAEPTTPSCLTYAYALYDLGRALALDHATAAAHAVLTERLRINNQRPLVEKQLGMTRQTHRSSDTAPSRSHAAPHHHASPRHKQPAAPQSGQPNPGGVQAPSATADTLTRAGSARQGGGA